MKIPVNSLDSRCCELLWPASRTRVVSRGLNSSAWVGNALLTLIAYGAIAYGAIACSGSDASNSENFGYLPAGAGGSGQTWATPEAIGFTPSTTLTLKLGSTAPCTVVVQPPDTYDVALALLGASSDAALSGTIVRTGPDGRAQFSVTASNIATSFAVRASVGQLSNELDVSVSDEGYASLNVSGNYVGNRSIEHWVSSLITGVPCTDFHSSLPSDGQLLVSSTSAQKIKISNVPVGATQSLILRGEYSVWGCKDIPSLVADEVLDLPVQVYDIPAVYGADPLPVNFEITTNADTWAANLALLNSQLQAAVLPPTTDNTALLLDAMRSAANNSQLQVDFDQRRISGNWQAILANAWSTKDGGSDGCISFAIDDWLSSSVSQLGKGVTIGTTLSLTSTSSSVGQEQLNLKSIAGVSTVDLQAPSSFPFKTTFGANDGLAASAELTFNEAYWVRALALSRAKLQFPGANDIPAALSALVGCGSIAASFDQAAPTSADCSQACLTRLCNDALAQLWTQTDETVAHWGTTSLTLSSSGNLRVDSHATVTGYTGTWVGVIASPSGNVSTGGSID